MLQSEFEVRAADANREELVGAIADVEVLWVRLRNMIDKQILDLAPKLKAIATNTTGLNHIDLDEAAKRNIAVVSLKGESEFLSDIRATAEHTIGLALALLRKIPTAHQHASAGGWDRYPFKGHELYEQTVGIIGYGRLGKIVAQYCLAFGMQILVSDPHVTDTDGLTRVELAELVNQSDVISLHVDYCPENHQMIDRSVFDQCKPGAIFINTARGELVNESDLLAALSSGKLAGAALDVVSEEHKTTDTFKALVEYAAQHDNLILTPHIGGNTFESHYKTEDFLANKVLSLFQNQNK